MARRSSAPASGEATFRDLIGQAKPPCRRGPSEAVLGFGAWSSVQEATELRSHGHCVDHDRLFLRVVVEDHNLQEPPGPIRPDDEIPPVAATTRTGCLMACCMSSSWTPCLRALSAISTSTR
jgi:hypothetical protein